MEKEEVKLEIVSKFFKGEKGLCADCIETQACKESYDEEKTVHPIEEMVLVAHVTYIGEENAAIGHLTLMCRDCFEALEASADEVYY